MRAHGMKLPPQRVRVAIPHAKETLEAAMRYFIGQEGREMVWLPEYDKVAGALEKNGVDTEFFWIGNQPVRGCIGCWSCRRNEGAGCAFKDQLYTDFIDKMRTSDGLIIGAPVYYAAPPGTLCAFLDRVCFSASCCFQGKPAAGVVNCRRGGASAAFDRLNKYFTILQMPVVSSQYWNSTHGLTPDEVREDKEGLQTMRVLGNNMAYLLHSLREAALPPPDQEPRISTNFIR